jgi:quercetin dioxygenase-like cupin family protein
MAKTHTAAASMCEIGGKRHSAGRSQKTVMYRHKGDFTWSGVKDEPYKAEGSEWCNIIRRVLIGAHGETSKFHVRYFEILPQGNSSLEQHRHEHVVIGVKGKGQVLTGRTKRAIGFMDTLYISPDTVHQLSNPYPEPFGFLCIVNARRDRPKVLRK